MLVEEHGTERGLGGEYGYAPMSALFIIQISEICSLM